MSNMRLTMFRVVYILRRVRLLAIVQLVCVDCLLVRLLSLSAFSHFICACSDLINS